MTTPALAEVFGRLSLMSTVTTTPSRGPHERNQRPHTASAEQPSPPQHQAASSVTPTGGSAQPEDFPAPALRGPCPLQHTHQKGGMFPSSLASLGNQVYIGGRRQGRGKAGRPRATLGLFPQGTGTPKAAAAATGPGARPPRCFTGTCRGGAGELSREGRMPGSRGPGDGEGPCTGQRRAPQVWGLERITERSWSPRADAYKQVAL